MEPTVAGKTRVVAESHGQSPSCWRPPAERLVPVLRELLAAGMVRRTGPDRAWELTEEARRQLDQLDRVSPDPSKVELYFGLRCSVCGEDTVTRRRDGRQLCNRCLRSVA
jgi:hypothetical protein